MALSDDIAEIKAHFETLSEILTAMHTTMRSQAESLAHLACHGIQSSGGDIPHKDAIFVRLTTLFNHIAKGRKLEAIIVVRQLTSCGLKEAKELVEVIHVADHD